MKALSAWIGGLLFGSMVSCAAGSRPAIEEVARYDTAGWAHDVSLENGRLYVSDRQGGYLIFDRALGWGRPQVYHPVKDVISLAPHSGRPLLAARFEGLVLASEEGKVAGSHANGDIANAAVSSGDLAFAAYGLHGLVVAVLREDGLKILAELPTPGWSHDVRLWENRALLADWNYGLRVVDVSLPDQPCEIGVLPTAATAISIALGQSHDRTMAAVAEGHAGVSIAAFDDAGHPVRIGRHGLGLDPAAAPHPETGGWAHGVAWCGDYLFVADWKRGLEVLDVRDPSRPEPVLRFPTTGTSLGVKAEAAPDGTILVFLADGEDGLRVLRFHPRGPH